MRQGQLGVLREDPVEDMRLLMENYTIPSLASAVRDREETLQYCAELMKAGDFERLLTVLKPYQHDYIVARRRVKKLDLSQPLTVSDLEILRKALTRMPRRVVQVGTSTASPCQNLVDHNLIGLSTDKAHQKRAGVVVALCNVHGVPSILLEKRSAKLRAHPDEVCLPGGMASGIEDTSIVATCLREMNEEIVGLPEPASVLGVLRCNWGEVHHLVGVAVTPVVCFVGEIGDLDLEPNPDEVAEVFTIPLVSILRKSDWIHREGFAPIFVGGPHVIWGLTGYIMERFVKDILLA
jgi:8-oxo-dGTP pyrophosphatase MutT (NUDIX family)